MRPATSAREAIAAAIALISAIDLRLRSGDERRKAVDAAIVGDHRLRLRLRLILRLRTVLAVAPLAAVAKFARLLLVALIGLTLARLFALLATVAHIGLRLLLLRHEAGFLAEAGEIVALLVAVIGDQVVIIAGLLRLRLVLAELLLSRRDQAEIMLRMLVVVLRRHRIA